MNFRPGDLDAATADALNALWREVQRLKGITATAPLQIDQFGGGPVISLGAPIGPPQVFTISGNTGTFNSGHRLTARNDGTVANVSPVSNLTSLVSPGGPLAAGANAIVFPADIQGTYWAFAGGNGTGGGGNTNITFGNGTGFFGNVTVANSAGIGNATARTIANGANIAALSGNVTIRFPIAPSGNALFPPTQPLGFLSIATNALDSFGNVANIPFPVVPANATYHGWVSNTAQDFAGNKSFLDRVRINTTGAGHDYRANGFTSVNYGPSLSSFAVQVACLGQPLTGGAQSYSCLTSFALSFVNNVTANNVTINHPSVSTNDVQVVFTPGPGRFYIDDGASNGNAAYGVGGNMGVSGTVGVGAQVKGGIVISVGGGSPGTGNGSVTSVDGGSGDGITLGGGPITESGTLTPSVDGGTLDGVLSTAVGGASGSFDPTAVTSVTVVNGRITGWS